MTAKKEMTATNLRIILSVAIGLIVIASIAGFVFLSGSLKNFAAEVSKVNGEAAASKNNIQSLQRTQAELQKYKDTASRAESIVSESASYQYQDQITRDLNNYANKAGIKITGFTFDSSSAGAPAAAAPVAGAPTAGAPVAAAPAGLNSKTITIQLEASVPYKSLLTFMNMIEQNLTKMQVAKVSLAKSSDNDENVAGQALAIEVYVK